MFKRVLVTRVGSTLLPPTLSKCLRARFFYNIYIISKLLIQYLHYFYLYFNIQTKYNASEPIEGQCFNYIETSPLICRGNYLCYGNIDLKC